MILLVLAFLLLKNKAKNFFTSTIEELLSNEDTPYFQELPTDDDVFNLEGKIYISTIVEGQSSRKRSAEYYLSSLTLGAETTFENDYAFGAGAAVGLGGAIFVSYCSIVTPALGNQSIFKSNVASVGGAICCLSSSVYFPICPSFISNAAYKCGGAIFFQGVFENDIDRNLVYSQKAIMNIVGNEKSADSEKHFENNTASELGGAICFSLTACCGLEQVSFFDNKAGLSGGAICSMNSPLAIISCTFKMNEAGCSVTRKIKEHTGKMKITTPTFMARGGGAIFFVADEYQAGFKNAEINQKASTRTLYTDCCCFAGNSANNATDFESSPGHDIMLDGYVSWTSFGDALIVNNHNSIGSSSRGSARAPIISKFDLKNISAVESCGDNIKIPDIAKTFMTFQSPGRIIATSETSNVPKPTEYIYRATPITELPYATTKSWTKNSTAQIVLAPTARTIQRTLITGGFIVPSFRSGAKVTMIKTRTFIQTITYIEIMELSYTLNKDGNKMSIYISTYSTAFTFIETAEIPSEISVSIEGGNEGGIKVSSAVITIVSIASALLFFVVVGIMIFIIQQRKAANKKKTLEEEEEKEEETSSEDVMNHIKYYGLYKEDDDDVMIGFFNGCDEEEQFITTEISDDVSVVNDKEEPLQSIFHL